MFYVRFLLISMLIGLFSAVSLAQFVNEMSAFDEPGAGDKNTIYNFLVPEGVTVFRSDGSMVHGGQIIGIPGEYITLLSSEEAKGTMDAGDHFNSKSQIPETAPSDGMAMISVQIPEGARIVRWDGFFVKGPTDLALMVKAADISKKVATEEDMADPQLLRGFSNK